MSKGLSTRYVRTGMLNPHLRAREERRERLMAEAAQIATVVSMTTEERLALAHSLGLTDAYIHPAHGRIMAQTPRVYPTALDTEAQVYDLVREWQRAGRAGMAAV